MTVPMTGNGPRRDRRRTMDDGTLKDPSSAKTFPQFVRAAAACFGDAVAITMKGQTIPDTAASFVELDRRSAELARGLVALGAGKGSRIGFLYCNGPDFAVTMAAIARIGAVAIPLSTLLKSNELVRVLRQCDVAGLIVQRNLLGHDYVERLCEALPELLDTRDPDLRIARVPFLRWVFSTGDALPPTIRDLGFLRDAAAGVPGELLLAIEAEVHPTDQMVEIYTSGSMALPKGVKHNHGPVIARSLFLKNMLKLERDREITVPLPMFWVGGLTMYLVADWAAGAVSACSEANPTNSRMSMGTVLAADDMARMPRNAVIWSLGMSETLGPYSYGDELRAPGYPLCAPIDHVAEGFEVRVADHAGTLVPDGGIGEIQVRGYGLTTGLHKVEQAQNFTPDGFYRTGDLGEVKGARILFVGRNGDMIKTASANVSPAEVEMEMQALPGVHSAYVVGIPDKERGQLLVAAVVPREGAELDFDAVQAELRGKLSSYKVPRAYVAITREEVPMLPSNKVSRRLIERLMAERLGRSAN